MVLRPQLANQLATICIYKQSRGFELRTTNRCRSTPVSTLLRKIIGQIFHVKYVFSNNRTFQVEIWKMVETNVLFFQFLSIRCSLNTSETRERELIPNKIPGVTFPRPPLQACFLGPSLIGSRSAFILDPCLTN